eukprot:jgi/Tetstr1/454283/TSEL_041202.t1
MRWLAGRHVADRVLAGTAGTVVTGEVTHVMRTHTLAWPRAWRAGYAAGWGDSLTASWGMHVTCRCSWGRRTLPAREIGRYLLDLGDMVPVQREQKCKTFIAEYNKHRVRMPRRPPLRPGGGLKLVRADYALWPHWTMFGLALALAALDAVEAQTHQTMINAGFIGISAALTHGKPGSWVRYLAAAFIVVSSIAEPVVRSVTRLNDVTSLSVRWRRTLQTLATLMASAFLLRRAVPGMSRKLVAVVVLIVWLVSVPTFQMLMDIMTHRVVKEKTIMNKDIMLAYLDAIAVSQEVWVRGGERFNVTKVGAETVVAFPGSAKVEDYILDAKVTDGRWTGPDKETYFLHRGFSEGHAEIRTALREATAGTLRITFTGHSLGAALATVAALDIKMLRPEVTVTCVTFGSPQVGDDAFVEKFNRKVDFSVRVYNPMDWVTRSMGSNFAHVDHGYPVATLRRDIMPWVHFIDAYRMAVALPEWMRYLGLFLPNAGLTVSLAVAYLVYAHFFGQD